LIEGNSIPTVIRPTNIHCTPILKLLATAGEKCERILGTTFANVPVHGGPADEISTFVGRQKNASTLETNPSLGDCYTFIAMETHSKRVATSPLAARSGDCERCR
jgi:hypothetical protein